MTWQTGCADTLQGRVHRFPYADGACYCGEVRKNRRRHERHILKPATPDGSKMAPVLEAIKARGGLTVSQIADAVQMSKPWVRRYALRVLVRAGKLVKVGQTRETDSRGAVRTVDIYGLPNGGPYPESTPHV